MTYNLLGISGSTRKDSLNTKLVRAFAARMPEGTTMDTFDIGTLPLFNQDNEQNPGEAVIEFKKKIRAADGIILATPEYNRSIPGPLKNAIDWASRPYGDNAWDNKPVFITGATGGAIGTAVAQAALKVPLSYLNTHVLGQPEFYLGGAPGKFDEAGTLTDEDTKKHIDGAVTAFLAFIDKLR
jgi:chromate reductase